MVIFDVIDACRIGDMEGVKKFIVRGGDLNQTYRIESGGEWTPLMSAIEHRKLKMIEFLLENGADINFQPEGDWSALHHAVDVEIDSALQTCGDVEIASTNIIRLLLENGGDISLKNNSGETPVDLAKEYRCKKIVELLLMYSSAPARN